MNRPPPYNKEQLVNLKNQLDQSFALGQGVIIGSSTVVSRKAHIEPREQPGLVHILIEKDAGETYMSLMEYEKVVHIDIFHYAAEIDITDLANRIRKAISRFFQIWHCELQTIPAEKELAALTLARGIHLVTGVGEGTVLEPLRQVYPPPARLNSHVHILAKISPNNYSFTHCIIEETKKSLTYQGVKLRPVQQIIHIHKTRCLKSGD